jgi:hypothetical protein
MVARKVVSLNHQRGQMGALPDAYRKAMVQMDGFVARLSLWALSAGGGGTDQRRPVAVRPVDAARLLGVSSNTARAHWGKWQDLWLDTGEGWVPNLPAWPDEGKWWHPMTPAAALRISRLSWPAGQIAIYLIGPLRRRRYAQDASLCVTVRRLAHSLGRSTATTASAIRELEKAQIIYRIAPRPGRETRLSTNCWLARLDDSISDTPDSITDTAGANTDTKTAISDTNKRKNQHAPLYKEKYPDNGYRTRAHRGMGLDVGEALLRDPLLSADQLLENAQSFDFNQQTKEDQ